MSEEEKRGAKSDSIPTKHMAAKEAAKAKEEEEAKSVGNVCLNI